MFYKYWNSGNYVAIIRAWDVPEHGISMQDFKHNILTECREMMYVSENIWCGKVKLQTKWPYRLEKTQI
jgi:hypothetical protein